MSLSKLLVTVVTGLLITAGASVLLGSKQAKAGPPQQPTISDSQQGGTLYAENCASCHGDKLQGQPEWRSPGSEGIYPAPPHDQTGHTWHHGDALLFNYTKLGGKAALAASGVDGFASGMPAFSPQLSDAEIWDILAYIKSTWPKRVRETQKVRTEGEQMQGGN